MKQGRRYLLGKTYEAVDEAITRAAPLPAQLPQNMPENLPAPAPAVRAGQNIENGNASAEEISTFRPLQNMGSLLTEHVWLIWLVSAAGLLMRKVTIYQGFRLECVASMKFGPPAKPGTYKLFLRAKDGDLENVRGSISIGYVAEAY